jgi:hypothetical protein
VTARRAEIDQNEEEAPRQIKTDPENAEVHKKLPVLRYSQ